MFIEKLSNKLARVILKNAEDENKISEADFSRKISIVLIYFFLTLAVVLIGTSLGVWQQLILSIVGVIYIRILSGGNHFNSPDTCFFITSFAILIVPLTYDYIPSRSIEPMYYIALISYLMLSPHSWQSNLDYCFRKIAVASGLIISYKYSSSQIIFLVFCLLVVDNAYNNNILRVKNTKWR